MTCLTSNRDVTILSASMKKQVQRNALSILVMNVSWKLIITVADCSTPLFDGPNWKRKILLIRSRAVYRNVMVRLNVQNDKTHAQKQVIHSHGSGEVIYPTIHELLQNNPVQFGA